jgi:hypothetical protein
MKAFIALALWVSFAVVAYATPRVSSTNHSEAAARRACLERARAAHHRVAAVRSIDKKGKDNFTVALRVQGTKRLLTCNYNGRSGGAQLHW